MSGALTARDHLGAELLRVRLRLLVLLERARALGWLPEESSSGWVWPSSQAVERALSFGVEGLEAGFAARLAAQEEVLAAAMQRSASSAGRLPLVALSRRFGLDALAVDALLLGAAADLDPAVGMAIQHWRRAADARLPDLELAVHYLDRPGRVGAELRRVFDPGSPLVEHALIELSRGPVGARSFFWTPSSVTRHLMGDVALDPDLGVIARLHAPGPLEGVAVAAARALAAHLGDPGTSPSAFLLLGPEGSGRRRAVQQAASLLGRPLLAVSVGAVAAHLEHAERLLVRLRRDAALTGAVVWLHAPSEQPLPSVPGESTLLPFSAEVPPNEAEQDAPELALHARSAQTRLASAFQALEHHLAWSPSALVVTGSPHLRLFAGTRHLRGRLLKPDEEAAAAALTAELQRTVGASAEGLALRETLRGFRLSPVVALMAGRRSVVATELDGADPGSPALTQRLLQGVHAFSHRELTSLAEQVTVRASWVDVILPSEVMERIDELLRYAACRQRVFYHWGFDEKMPTGRALTALFAGPSGTGKTFVAGIIARELGSPLYRVDLSRVVSKYIGETERQLARVFEESQREGAILLFDEADALFTARTRVQSSNDRYSNLGVNFLLQKLDTFEGVAILTTNHEQAIDEALIRRIKVRVQFPMPDEAAREQLWESHIPRKAPIQGGIDFGRLAREFELSGANIRNAVLRACLRSADLGEPLTEASLRMAAERECVEMGKLVRQRSGG